MPPKPPQASFPFRKSDGTKPAGDSRDKIRRSGTKRHLRDVRYFREGAGEYGKNTPCVFFLYILDVPSRRGGERTRDHVSRYSQSEKFTKWVEGNQCNKKSRI